jgi:hypothetical protein
MFFTFVQKIIALFCGKFDHRGFFTFFRKISQSKFQFQSKFSPIRSKFFFSGETSANLATFDSKIRISEFSLVF